MFDFIQTAQGQRRLGSGLKRVDLPLQPGIVRTELADVLDDELQQLEQGQTDLGLLLSSEGKPMVEVRQQASNAGDAGRWITQGFQPDMTLNPDSGDAPDSDEALRRSVEMGGPPVSADPTTARWLAWLKEDNAGRPIDKTESSADLTQTHEKTTPERTREPAPRTQQPMHGHGGADLDDAAAVDAPFFSVSGFSLFWRTFGLISLLLSASTLTWLETLNMLKSEPRQGVWLLWLVVGVLLSLAGVAFVAHLINQPFKQLSFAT
ncbi:hypothetical protein P3G55_25850, partial [Leptospira sp. 96542]|nr:hypothetical protein [Leptospira sp. 96542]